MKDKHIIPGLEKGIRLFEYIGNKPNGTTQSELIQVLGLTQTTCYRILNTFEKNGWLIKNKDNSYDFSFGLLPCLSKIVTLGNKVKHLEPLVQKLSHDTELTVKVSIAEGNQQVSILRQNSSKPLAVAVKIGTRFPIIEGSVSGALLCRKNREEILKIASKTKERIIEKLNPEMIIGRINKCLQDGFCTTGPDSRWNIEAISAPIADSLGNVIAALTLVGFREDFANPTQLAEKSNKLLKTIKECEKTLNNG